MSQPNWPGTAGFPAIPYRSSWGTKSVQFPFATGNGESAATTPETFWGTGSPAGVISAKPGDLYFQTTGANAAQVWTKVIGTATNTGWFRLQTGVGFYDVDVFGADPLGVADSTAAINTTITAAAAGATGAIGGIVRGHGKYKITAPIVIPIAVNSGAVILKGDGMRTTYLEPTFDGVYFQFGAATQDPSGTTTNMTFYCGLEDWSVSGGNAPGVTASVGVQFLEMQMGWVKNCIIEQIAKGIGLYLLGSDTTGGLGASAYPHTWRCYFDHVIVATTQRPLVVQNADENAFSASCNFGTPTGLGAISADSIFAIELRQGHNNRFYGALCSGDDSNKSPYVGVYLRAAVNAAGVANGDNLGHSFWGLVAEGFDRVIWQENGSTTRGNSFRSVNPSIYNTFFRDDAAGLGHCLLVESSVITPPVNYFDGPGAYGTPVSVSGTTPDVSGGDRFAATDSSPVSVTTFTNFASGRRITYRTNANVTLVDASQAGGNNLRLHGRQNVVGMADLVLEFVNISGILYEVARAYDVTGMFVTRVLFQAVGLTSTSTSDASVTSFALPAGLLTNNGRGIRIRAGGRQTTQAGSVNVKFGATVLGTVAPAAGASWEYEVIVGRSGSTAQLATGHTGTGATYATIAAQPGETLANSITVDFRGSVTAGGTLDLDYAMIELL